MVAPALTITASGEHAGFPGTLSIGNEVMVQASWSSWCAVPTGAAGWCSSTGTAATLRPCVRACRTLAGEGRRALAWWPKVRDGDAHAGHTETSLMLAIAPTSCSTSAPSAVASSRSASSSTSCAPAACAVSANGVLGDPNGANATHGRALLARMTIDLVAAVDEWWT